MTILHNTDGNRFEAYSEEGENMGNIVYEPDGGVLRATHTWVSDDFRGQGVAGKLLDALVQYAVANSLKIVPVCGYVIGAFEKDPERYRAVMADQ